MSKLTLDEAISRALEEAGEYQERADSAELIDILDGLDVESCKECAADHRQLAEWLTELKEARKLLTPTRYKTVHEEWDMHGEHYRSDYASCPNCGKVFTNIYDGKAAPVVSFCPNCGQKIDWGTNDEK